MNEWDNDINNLFKRAAKEYPLKTGKGEWYKVEKNLYENNIATKSNTRYSFFRKNVLTAIIILLLIFGISVSYHSIFQPPSANTTAFNASELSHTKKQKLSSTNSATNEIQSQTNPNAKTAKKDFLNKPEYLSKAPINKSEIIPKSNSYLPIMANSDDYTYSNNISLLPIQQSEIVSNNFEKEISIVSLLAVNKPINPVCTSTMMDVQMPLALFNPDAVEINDKANEPHKIILKLSPFFHKFYIGLTGSAELSKVKNSGFTSPGNSFSLVTGYRLNTNLSVESGVRRNNLFYKSYGSYYDRSNLNLTSMAEIVNVNGYNRISEIPFLMRYHFTSHTKNSFTIAAGTNISILHQENYSYLVNRFGKSESISREYNKTSAKLFSNFIISAGHESYLVHNTTLRIEPYYKIPIRTTGNGNLAVTGMGANIGLITYLK